METAIIAGVGPGLGSSLARAFSRDRNASRRYCHAIIHAFRQPSSAWTHEIDIRPAVEIF